MRLKLRHLWIFVPVLALLLAACGDSDDDGMSGMDMNSESTATAPAGDPTMPAGMNMSETPDASVDPDLAFIDGMIPHHEGAIVMAEMAFERAEHQELKDLSQEIIDAQESEIAQMREWRSEWFGDVPETGGMAGMEGMGMMSDADMDMMESTDMFDQMFIDMMIEHHQSAIDMAQEIQTTTERPEIQQLAADIISSQQAEIDQMEQWRSDWFS
jgi:uncharacterized protein (DUF305 family)